MKKTIISFSILSFLLAFALINHFGLAQNSLSQTSINQVPQFYQTSRQVRSAILIFKDQQPSPIQVNLALDTLFQNLKNNQTYKQVIILNSNHFFPLSQTQLSTKLQKYFPKTKSHIINFNSTDSEATIYTKTINQFSDNTLLILPTSLLFNHSDPVLEKLQTEYFRIAFDNLTKKSLSNLPFNSVELIKAFYQLNKDHHDLRTLPALNSENHQFILKYFTNGDRLTTPQVSLTFMGDIMLGRLVRTYMNRKSLDYPFSKIDPSYLKFNNLLIANLEGPITTKTVYTSKSITFHFLPDIAPLLKKYSFDLLGRANNHAYDMGQNGFNDTKIYLNQQGINVFGDAKNIDNLTTYKTLINGEKIAFLGLNDTNFKLDQSKKKALSTLISKLIIDGYQPIVFIHWGVEYQHTPQDSQITFAHQLIDQGVIAIIGMHSNVVQSFEIYKHHPIFYSLGNFIFDQYFSTDTQEGLTVNLVIRPSQIKVSLFPVKIIKSQPQLMNQNEKKAFLNKLVTYWRYNNNIKQQILQGQIVLNTSDSI